MHRTQPIICRHHYSCLPSRCCPRPCTPPGRNLPPLLLPQVGSLGPGSNQLAVTVGTAVLIVTCSDLKPPTLVNLLGALSVDKALAAARRGGGGGDAAGSGLLPLPPPAGGGGAAGALLGSTAAVSPAAAAAARVLHGDELAALCAPFGGALRPVVVDMQLEEPEQPGQWLVRAREVSVRCTDAEGDAAVAAEERRVWQAVQQPAAAALGSDAALRAALEPLLELRRRTGLPLSHRLLCGLLMLAAGERRRRRAGSASAPILWRSAARAARCCVHLCCPCPAHMARAQHAWSRTQRKGL